MRRSEQTTWRRSEQTQVSWEKAEGENEMKAQGAGACVEKASLRGKSECEGQTNQRWESSRAFHLTSESDWRNI